MTKLSKILNLFLKIVLQLIKAWSFWQSKVYMILKLPNLYTYLGMVNYQRILKVLWKEPITAITQDTIGVGVTSFHNLEQNWVKHLLNFRVLRCGTICQNVCRKKNPHQILVKISKRFYWINKIRILCSAFDA